ncbi:MAG TPA: SDR family oxidoreductase [Solirubrobacteraceae bacterium]|nr:SDR family oxidoreductase [Solirubrobacteraceae bacterium]
MTATVASELLRPRLLEGVSVLLAGADSEPGARESRGAAVREACAGLGARVSVLPPVHDPAVGAEEGEAAIDEAVEGALAELGGVELLVVDGAGLFAAALRAAGGQGGPEGARAALRTCLDVSWNVTRAVVNRAFLERGGGGRIVYLAPASDAGEHAEAARAGLENLARTLSIEWARHGITVVTIASMVATPAGDVAALTAYLASPAGAYFSGCLLDLRGVAA